MSKNIKSSCTPMDEISFVNGFKIIQEIAHSTARSKGFWSDRDALEGLPELGKKAEILTNLGLLMLAAGEIAEASEAIRLGNPPDDKIPAFSGAEAECADAIIRLMDQAEARGWRLAEAIIAKMKFNANRPHMHGKKA